MQVTKIAALLSFVAGALATISAGECAAAKLGSPTLEISIWGIKQDDPFGPGELLNFATHVNGVNGVVEVREQIGVNTSGNPAWVIANTTEDGVTFWVHVDTPNNYQSAVNYIGGRAHVDIYQSFTKDSLDAALNFTYTYADLFGYVNPETSGPCRQGQQGECLQASMVSWVEVYDASNTLVWFDTDAALIVSKFANPAYETTLIGDWPWIVDNNPYPTLVDVEVKLPRPVTQQIDLSAIELNEEFTVAYHLRGWAIDQSSDLGTNRGTNVQARDPLSGDTGVGTTWDLTGLTPTNRPTVTAPIPEPSTWMTLAAGLGILAAAAASRRRRQRL